VSDPEKAFSPGFPTQADRDIVERSCALSGEWNKAWKLANFRKTIFHGVSTDEERFSNPLVGHAPVEPDRYFGMSVACVGTPWKKLFRESRSRSTDRKTIFNAQSKN
jgi:hypothetical protein